MEKELQRKCVATGEIKSQDELLRFVKTPDSRLVPDFNKKLEGRGLYVSNSKTA
ncbi:MAG: YlxR family protein, partial [Alphaproteobacteria bacterium]